MARKTHTRDLIQTELLSTLHGVSLDASGQESKNIPLLAALFTVAEGFDTQTGSFIPIFPVNGNLRWCDSARMCSYCRKLMTRGLPNMCGGCRISYYCSEGCQKADWKNGHKKLCMQGQDQDYMPYLRTMLKGLSAIERIIIEKGSDKCESGAYPKFLDSPLHEFMQGRNIEADTFMAIPVRGDATELTQSCDGKPDNIGIVFFKSEKVLEFLRETFCEHMTVAGDNTEDATTRQEYRESAKAIREEIRTITNKDPGQMLIIGSFDHYPLAIRALTIMPPDH